MEELDAKKGKPISLLLYHIPPWKWKAKFMKDPDYGKFTVLTPLLPEHVEFEGTVLARIPVLEMEDWDLVDHKRFLHLATRKYMNNIYYEETGVMMLEPMKWVRGVKQARLLHMLCISDFHRIVINTMCVH